MGDGLWSSVHLDLNYTLNSEQVILKSGFPEGDPLFCRLAISGNLNHWYYSIRIKKSRMEIYYLCNKK